MIFADKLIMTIPDLPPGMRKPASTQYTTEIVKNLSGSATYYEGTIETSGWYKIVVSAADGSNTQTETSRGKGGYVSHIFFAYSGAKYLMWGCHSRETGYPWPTGNGCGGSIQTAEDGFLGGGGGKSSGRTFTSGGTTRIARGGAGGGSATGHGGVGTGMYADDPWYQGGGGTGFICGTNFMGATGPTETETFSDHTFSLDNMLTMVLAGGGGGPGGAGGGGGGGAYGNGGNGYDYYGTAQNPSAYTVGGTGPGGTSGQGTNGTAGTADANGVGGNGGWAIRDYTTNTFSYGSGNSGTPGAETCILYKLIY